MFESDRWDGGFKAVTSTVVEDSTGTTITACDGKRYCLSGISWGQDPSKSNAQLRVVRVGLM